MRAQVYAALLLAAVCVASAYPQQSVVDGSVGLLSEASSQPDEAVETPQKSSPFKLQTVTALLDTFRSWLAPVKRVIHETVQKKTVSEVASEARNATVDLANQVSESQVFQSVQDAFTPLKRMFVQVRDSVKDKTLAQMADDVQQQIDRVDQSVAKFIKSFVRIQEAPESAPANPVPQPAADPERV